MKNITIGCAVPSVAVGDTYTNELRICEYITKAAEVGCNVLTFPELAITGYTCADLFLQDLLQEAAKVALKRIVAFTKQYPVLYTVIGLPLRLDAQLYNCAAVVCGGKLLGIVPKRHLTNDRESPEGRWFVPGDLLSVKTVSAELVGLEAYPVPVGVGQVFAADGFSFGVEICEDLFRKDSPSYAMAEAGAQLILNPAASIQLAGKQNERRALVKAQSAACGCVYAFCSAGSSESTRDAVYSGHCVIAENGRVVAESQELVADDRLITADVKPCRKGCVGKRGPQKEKAICKHPFAMDEQACGEMFAIQAAGLARRLQQLNAKPVIGVSGGLDSTLALLVCVEAVKRLGRPVCDVHAVTMPCFGTTDRTYRNALSLMKILGVTIKEIGIGQAVMQHFADIGHDPNVRNTTYENAQARERTQILMDYAGLVGGIVVGTGDLSELALGWCTYNGDHMSMYAVNASIPKTVIPPIIRTVSAMVDYRAAAAVLEDVIATPISPELLPADASGNISQKTEDLVGPYELHDFFLYYAVKVALSPAAIYAAACEAFSGEYDADTVKKWLRVFYRRFFAQQFKRSCMPEGVKVTDVSFGPRGDWLMPSDASAALWLREVDQL